MFTQSQIDALIKNKNVLKCSSSSITYSKNFKVKAVKRYYEDGFSPRMIFEEAGFNMDAIGEDRASDSLLRWRRTYDQRGEKTLLKDGRGSRGRPKKLEFKTKEEEIKYLKTKVKYLKAENDFLAKLRGLKRE